MIKKLMISIFAIFSCTTQRSDEHSEGAALAGTSPLPTSRSHFGIFRITDPKTGKSLVFVPRILKVSGGKHVTGNGGPGEDLYNKYVFSKDWKTITTSDMTYNLLFSELNSNSELKDIYFRRGDGYGESDYFGKISDQKELNVRLDDCSSLKGKPVFDVDIIEKKLPEIEDEIYILPPIRSVNPLKKPVRRTRDVRLVNLKVDAIFSDVDKKEIVITSKTNALQDFYLDSFYINGLPVFSKKTHRIVGIIDNYRKNEKLDLNGDLNVRIISVFSDVFRNSKIPLNSLPAKTEKYLPPSVSQEWKVRYCNPQNVDEIIRKRIQQEEERAACAATKSHPKGAKTTPRPPWQQDIGCDTSKEKVLSAIQRIVSAQEKRDDASCQGVSQEEDPNWIYSPPELVPQICAREVYEAIAARVAAEKACQPRPAK